MLSLIWEYIINVLTGFDRFANSLLFGDPRMTLSARMGRDIEDGRCWLCRPVCAVLNIFESHHCTKAWASEQVPVDASEQLTKE